MIITLDKYNKKTFSPEFKDGKVFLFEIENSNLAGMGEDWDFIILSDRPLNKKDKRGQEMLVRKVNLTEQKFQKSYPLLINGEIRVEVSSGDVKYPDEVIPSTIDIRFRVLNLVDGNIGVERETHLSFNGYDAGLSYKNASMCLGIEMLYDGIYDENIIESFLPTGFEWNRKEIEEYSQNILRARKERKDALRIRNERINKIKEFINSHSKSFVLIKDDEIDSYVGREFNFPNNYLNIKYYHTDNIYLDINKRYSSINIVVDDNVTKEDIHKFLIKCAINYGRTNIPRPDFDGGYIYQINSTHISKGSAWKHKGGSEYIDSSVLVATYYFYDSTANLERKIVWRVGDESPNVEGLYETTWDEIEILKKIN